MEVLVSTGDAQSCLEDMKVGTTGGIGMGGGKMGIETFKEVFSGKEWDNTIEVNGKMKERIII